MVAYIALLHKDADSDFGVSFPDLPGCVSAGTTLDDARAMAEEALALHLAGLVEDGEAIPEPSGLDVVMADAANRDGVAVLIPATVPAARAVRVNITLPEDLLADVDRYAQDHGMSRSGLLATAARRFVKSAA